MNSIYSNVKEITVPGMVLAQYAVISRYPEDDSLSHLEEWITKCGLRQESAEIIRIIGWDFPFVSEEQRNILNMRGYVSACILPDGYKTECEGAEIIRVEQSRYAVLTITDPHRDSLRIIPNGYKKLFEYIENNQTVQLKEDCGSFEEEYSRGGIQYMDIYVPIK